MILGSGCSTDDAPKPPTRHIGHAKKFEDYLPPNSTGRRPAGTRDDPFIGRGVMMAIGQRRDGLIRAGIRHQDIPHFKLAAEMGVYVTADTLGSARDGDFVLLYFAELRQGTPERAAYERVTSAGDHSAILPYQHFGYELYRIKVVPDAEGRTWSPAQNH
jgi:hypothetical protein